MELARPRRGSVILVHSAAGGVGGALVQLGKVAGCTVVAVVGAPSKVEVARKLGADAIIDKSQGELVARSRKARAERIRRRLRRQRRLHIARELSPSRVAGKARHLRLSQHAPSRHVGRSSRPRPLGIARPRLRSHTALRSSGHDEREPKRPRLQPVVPLRSRRRPHRIDERASRVGSRRENMATSRHALRHVGRRVGPSRARIGAHDRQARARSLRPLRPARRSPPRNVRFSSSKSATLTSTVAALLLR